ncbi:RNA polymerase II subunit A C-terminal domain phosphatase isoform X2 [Fukomys damarensis]|uniref:RNA polymerase II subunit A C-terminal domain phosphatase isoform X2 n=1 Tax=Fukomys damarensis TaxID=885580 RepID=UPI001455837D|nr:RNA polymerase II subunit A C-terminal domain phosphatase isoform X2 [Fukomys damarensis]
MVCIIDDREDVWKFAPNLITVKKYVYLPGTGDVNAPPGSRESQMRKKVNHSSKDADVLEQVPFVKDPEEGRHIPGLEQSNGLGKPARELNGTEKVRQAQECRHLHVVSPDWLWSCLESWDKVEEQLFPLTDDDTQANRENSPATFPDRQNVLPTALFHPTPIHPKAQPGPEVRIYDSNTGKLIRMGVQGSVPGPPSSLPIHREPTSFRAVLPHQQQMFGEELPDARDGEQPGPARRKRQPSMSETMPLYTLCKEDLESMDKERPQEEAERRGCCQ